jgi:hypothetical protein
MRFNAGVAAVVAAGTTFVCVAPASAQQTGTTCSDFPTQIDMERSVPPNPDPSVLDPDGDGVGCEENPGPPAAYNLFVFPPLRISEGPPLEVSPTSGPPGTAITVLGEDCDPPDGQIAHVDLFNQTAQQSVAHDDVSVDDGQESWSAELTVPAGVDPDDAFVVVASCLMLGSEQDLILAVRYAPVAWDVIGAPTAPPAPAAPATPVPAEPTFTG